MHRTYIFRRAGMPKALAAVAVAAVVAGCGGGGSTTPTSGANATPTPTPSGVGVGVDSQLGGSASGRAAGKISHGSAGSVVKASGQRITRTTAGSISQPGGNSSVTSKQQQNAAQRAAAQRAAAERAAAQRAAAQRAAAERAAAKRAAQKTTTTAPPSVSTPRTVTVTVRERTRTPPPKTKVRTVTKTKVKTVVHTVTKTVPPNVPAGAFLPSKHPVLAQPAFTVAGSNIACELASGAVRCAILRRVWAAPVQPSSCKGVWGDTIALTQQGVAAFVCSTRPISTDTKVIPIGYDDQLGNFTCEVRSFGVDCFSPDHHGFIFSRTGYAFY